MILTRSVLFGIIEVSKRKNWLRLQLIGECALCQADWEQQTDERLALAAKNQQAAMAVLLNRYSNRIWFHARRLCGVLDAEDLAQEGFLGLCGAVL